MSWNRFLEPQFHPNSYGYRPGRSALDAIAMVRRRCWEYDWVIEFDIKGLFDNIDHALLMRAVRKHCQNPWVLIDDLSRMFNPVLRGWMNYYGRFHGSAMDAIWKHLNAYLARWLTRKYKTLARHKRRAWRALGQLAVASPQAFVHWELGYVPRAG